MMYQDIKKVTCGNAALRFMLKKNKTKTKNPQTHHKPTILLLKWNVNSPPIPMLVQFLGKVS